MELLNILTVNLFSLDCIILTRFKNEVLLPCYKDESKEVAPTLTLGAHTHFHWTLTQIHKTLRMLTINISVPKEHFFDRAKVYCCRINKMKPIHKAGIFVIHNIFVFITSILHITDLL